MSGRGKTVGVLGGMGPAATLHFLQALLAATPAERDQDHLRVLVDNNPQVPDRNAALAGTGPSPGPVLAEMARRLEAGGADILVMPCNTAHAWAGEIEAAVATPFLNIVELTTAAAFRVAPDLRNAVVLAAPGAVAAGLYQRAFGERGVVPVVPRGEARQRFGDILYRIKAGGAGLAERADMRRLALDMLGEGEVIVSACTEVPLALSAADVPVPLVDCTVELAAATVARALA